MMWNGMGQRRERSRSRSAHLRRPLLEDLESRWMLTADLTLTGSATPEPAAQNGYLRYDYTVTNNGPDPATATFSDVVPASLTIIQVTSDVGTVSQTGNTVQIDLGTMENGDQAHIRILTVPTLVSTITNTAQVTAPNDPNQGDNSLTLISTVQLGTNLTISATATPDPVVTGNELDFFFVVSNPVLNNISPAIATNVVVTDNIPDNLDLLDVQSTQGTVTISPDQKSFSVAVGTLGVGAAARILVRTKPKDGVIGPVSNFATATSTQPIKKVNIDTPGVTGGTTAQVVQSLPPVPNDTTPPTVTDLRRFGVHKAVTSIVLTFSEALDATTAENLANYSLVLARQGQTTVSNPHLTIPIRSATYDATNRTVTLVLRRRLALTTLVQLTVNGSSATGVANLSGVLLDGAGNGQPGSNFVRTFRGLGPGML